MLIQVFKCNGIWHGGGVWLVESFMMDIVVDVEVCDDDDGRREKMWQWQHGLERLLKAWKTSVKTIQTSWIMTNANTMFIPPPKHCPLNVITNTEMDYYCWNIHISRSIDT